MVQDTYNIVPVTLAVMLHTLVFGSLFVAFDLSRTAAPPMPLSMKATLVSADSIFPPPVIRRPEPDLVQPEPERVQPDPAALRRAEDEKRRADARREQERLDQLERVRLEARLERERERRRQEMEEERLRDIAQQRQDNILEEERLLRESQDALIAAEEEGFAAQNSTEAQAYQNMIVQKVRRNWARPGIARAGLKCIVAVQQLPGGEVVSASVIECNAGEIVRRSVENAVLKASPLPQPSNPLLFLRTFQFTFVYNGD